MTQLFTLQLSDNTTTIDFISSTIQVQNGGFDISLPRAKNNLVFMRPGFYRLLDTQYEFRESKLRFNIKGSTRAAILTSLNQIEKMLGSAAARSKTGKGSRIQLAYAWEGATNITYFEVYAGELSLPGDVLSVEKILIEMDGKLLLPDVELSLTVSPHGYGASVFDDTISSYEVALCNAWTASAATGGITVSNDKYAEIPAYEIEGTGPALLKLGINHATYTAPLSAVHIGLVHEDNFVSDDYYASFGVPHELKITASLDGWGKNGSVYYEDIVGHKYGKKVEASRVYLPDVPQITWLLSDFVMPGTYYTFMRSYDQFPTTQGFACGWFDPLLNSARLIEDLVVPTATGRVLPLGSVSFPHGNFQAAGINYVDSLYFGLWYAVDNVSGGTVTVYNVRLLPITNGMRVINMLRSYSSINGSIIDDDWRGVTYFKALTNPSPASYSYYSDVYGMLGHLRLTPGMAHRLFFHFTSHAQANVALDEYTLRAYVVPTYATVAL